MFIFDINWKVRIYCEDPLRLYVQLDVINFASILNDSSLIYSGTSEVPVSGDMGQNSISENSQPRLLISSYFHSFTWHVITTKL